MMRELFQVIRERNFGKLSSAEKNVVSLMDDLKVLKPVKTANHFDYSLFEYQEEVYDALMEAVQTINSKTIKPKGVLYAQAVNGKIIIGFALCNYNYFDWNKENKAVLKEIAKGRAMTWGHLPLEKIKIPESILLELYGFINRANRYFKDEKLVDWARDYVGDVAEPVSQTTEQKTYTPQNVLENIMKELGFENVNVKYFEF